MFSNAKGKVCSHPDGELPPNAGLVETSDKLLKSDTGILARALARRQYTVPLRNMNLSDSSKTIYPGILVDELSQLEEIVSLIPQTNIEMPANLKELYDKCTREFYDDQKLRTKHLLIKYAAFILETDEDALQMLDTRSRLVHMRQLNRHQGVFHSTCTMKLKSMYQIA